MFNPYVRYDAKYLAEFQKKGVKAFVKQRYRRGENLLVDPSVPAFLYTHYSQMHMAQNHMLAIAHDPERRLLLLDNADDMQDLQKVGKPETGEIAYLRFAVKDAAALARKILDKKLHAYISEKLKWRVPRVEGVTFSMEFIFGDIYVELRYGTHYHRVNIEDIETTKGYVL